MNRHASRTVWPTIAAAALATVVGASIAAVQSARTVHSGVDAGHPADRPDPISTAKLPPPTSEPAVPRPVPAPPTRTGAPQPAATPSATAVEQPAEDAEDGDDRVPPPTAEPTSTPTESDAYRE